MLAEQPSTLTVIASRNPLGMGASEARDEAARFISARRVWLPAAPGSDWLHDGVREVVGPTGVHYAVETRRESVEIGAGGGELEVAVILYVLAEHTEVGRRLQGDVYEWVKRRVVERRKETGYENADAAPDFSTRRPRELAESARSELADVAKVPESRLQLLSAERREQSAVYAVYRDERTGVEYSVEVRRDDAIFSRLD